MSRTTREEIVSVSRASCASAKNSFQLIFAKARAVCVGSHVIYDPVGV